MAELFPPPEREELAPGAVLLRGRALAAMAALLADLAAIEQEAPFRHMTTSRGFAMSVAMTSCGALGWITDRQGYRYVPRDPLTGRPWPAMPAAFLELATTAARAAGFEGFLPDTCLINRYLPWAKMGLHQDKDEADFAQPIVSVSLGLPATFQFGGVARTDRVRRIPLHHGDVLAWGGPSRLAFHGILPLADGHHDLLGRQRLNLTFRRAGPST